jgi:hypothetical protein
MNRKGFLLSSSGFDVFLMLSPMTPTGVTHHGE